MAIGDGWAEGSWIDASWITGAWAISIEIPTVAGLEYAIASGLMHYTIRG